MHALICISVDARPDANDTCSAREASKRIVEDLLLTAGGSVTDDLDEDSPSVVKRGGLLEEDTF